MMWPGVMEHFKDKIITWKLSSVGHNPTAEQYLGETQTEADKVFFYEQKDL